MEISLNGKLTEIEHGYTLDKIPEYLCINNTDIALAVNNKVIPKAIWKSTILNSGDKVTAIKAVCGG